MDNQQFVVGCNIRAELSRRGLRQLDLANFLGVSIAAVSAKIRGKRGITTDELVAISRFLEVSPSILLGESPTLIGQIPVVIPLRAAQRLEERTVSLTAQQRLERKDAVFRALQRVPMPSQKELAEEFGCAQATISNIRKQLKAEGKIAGNSPKVRRLFVDSVSAMCADIESSLVAA
jgi:transcriptional regulator with XRE-family HTH domain